jgi:hypothetical protein
VAQVAVEEQQEAVSDVKSQFEEVGAELEALLKLETVEASERVTGLVETQERLDQKLTAVSEAKARHREKQSPRQVRTSAVLVPVPCPDPYRKSRKGRCHAGQCLTTKTSVWLQCPL